MISLSKLTGRSTATTLLRGRVPKRPLCRGRSLDELEAHLAEANANGLPVHFLGAGANTIAMSRVPGMTIRITIKGVEMSAAPNGDVLVKCGAGEVFDDIVARTLKAGAALPEPLRHSGHGGRSRRAEHRRLRRRAR